MKIVYNTTLNNSAKNERSYTSANGSSSLTLSSCEATGVCRAVSSNKTPCKSLLTPTDTSLLNTILFFSGRYMLLTLSPFFAVIK